MSKGVGWIWNSGQNFVTEKRSGGVRQIGISALNSFGIKWKKDSWEMAKNQLRKNRWRLHEKCPKVGMEKMVEGFGVNGSKWVGCFIIKAW